MAASVSGSKTVTQAVSPTLPAGTLTTLLATPVEQLTVKQLRTIQDAISRVPQGGNESSVIGNLLV